MKKSEGVKRLSLLLGVLGALGWITFVVIVTELFTTVTHSLKPWLIIVFGLVLAFLLPFGITKGIAWVIDGFKQDKSK